MPDKSKTAKELVELSAEQSEHAAKNLAAAGEKAVGNLLPHRVPMGEEGFAFGVRISNKTIATVAAGLGVFYGARIGNRLWDYKKARDARKAAKVVSVDTEPRERKAG